MSNLTLPTTQAKKNNDKDDFSFMDSFFGTSKESFPSQEKSDALEFDYISKSLEESSKKTSSIKPLDTKKEKTIFDGIKDNQAPTQENKNLSNSNVFSNFSIKSDNKRDNYNNTNTNTNTYPQTNSNNYNNNFDKFDFNSLTNSNTNYEPFKSSNTNAAQYNFNQLDAQKSFPNIDFSKTSNKPKDLNILDSLLSDLPSNNKVNSGNLDFGQKSSASQNINPGFNLNSNQNDDYYSLDFLKSNNKNNQKQAANNLYNPSNQNNFVNDPFFDLLKK
jgi:hypothetical protein